MEKTNSLSQHVIDILFLLRNELRRKIVFMLLILPRFFSNRSISRDLFLFCIYKEILSILGTVTGNKVKLVCMHLLIIVTV
jgi:hypothetical protein